MIHSTAGRSGSDLVQDALRECAAVARRRARNFYYGMKLLPEPQRSAVFALYAWMRRVDDLVDSAGCADAGATRERLSEFRAATEAALRGQPGDEAVWVALAATAARFHLPAGILHSMIDGQIEDLEPREFTTFDELRAYCTKVASTVGLLCIEIWGYADPAARELAVERGIAFQLTNILRDYAQDFDAGRVYLPREDFQRYGIDPQTLRHWSAPDACARMFGAQVRRAQSLYERSAGLDSMITASCRPTLWAMTTIYRELLAKMQRSPSRLMQGRRMRLSALRKAGIALQARWRARSPRRGGGRVGARASTSAPA